MGNSKIGIYKYSKKMKRIQNSKIGIIYYKDWSIIKI